MTVLDEEQESVVAPTEDDLAGLVRFGPCRALGHDFELYVPPHAKQLKELGGLVRPFRVQADADVTLTTYVLGSPDDKGICSLMLGDRLLAKGQVRTRDFRGAMAWNINQAVIESSVERHWLMHSAAVTREGYTIILPADMESGKTTTTAGLLREGFGYVTDEAVAIDPETLQVTPFPKTLSIDPGSWPLFPELANTYGTPRNKQWHVPASDLGAHTPAGPVAPPALVVIPKYVGGEHTELTVLGDAEAVFELARMTFHFGLHPRRNLEAIHRLVRQATVVRLRIGTLEGAVDAIEGLLSQRILEDR